MKKVLIGVAVLLCVACSFDGGDLGENKHTIPLVVIEAGGCKTFLGDVMYCAIKAKYADGSIVYTKVDEHVVSGQTVYKHCWTEDDGDYCFQNARTRISNLYNPT